MRSVNYRRISLTIREHAHHSGKKGWAINDHKHYCYGIDIKNRIVNKISKETIFRCPLGYKVFYLKTIEKYGNSLCVV